MAIHFSRSLRSLQSDSHRPAVATVIMASVLVVVWFGWLVLARIELYKASRDWEVARDGSLIVRFPVEAMPSFRPGQVATVDCQTDANEALERVSAMVADTPSRTQNRLAADTVEVALLGELPTGTTGGVVTIAVGTVSPLTLITRATVKPR
ncbi:MAG: hypothetical protein AB1806_11775 [Acidobacteriota bacterium]